MSVSYRDPSTRFVYPARLLGDCIDGRLMIVIAGIILFVERRNVRKRSSVKRP